MNKTGVFQDVYAAEHYKYNTTRAFVHWFDVTGREIGIIIAIDSITGTSLWAKTSTTVTPPRGATKGAVEIRVRTNGGTAYVDDVICTPVP
jgi:hypothetical protein